MSYDLSQAAVRDGVSVLVIVGEDERKSGEITVKDLRTREQHRLPLGQLGDVIRMAAANATPTPPGP